MQPKLLFAVLLAGTLTPAWAAHAQGVIPSAIANAIMNSNRSSGPPAPCMRGEPGSERQIAEARADAQAVMQIYVARAGAAMSTDASAAFTRREAERSWRSSETEGNATAVNDPLARAVAAGTGRSTLAAFIRSGDGRSAQGVWLTTSADGAARLGHYEIMFRREGGGLRITRLTLMEGSDEPTAIRQYCQSPGDVEQYIAEQIAHDRRAGRIPPDKPNDPSIVPADAAIPAPK
jgi:hypothetical protein